MSLCSGAKVLKPQYSDKLSELRFYTSSLQFYNGCYNFTITVARLQKKTKSPDLFIESGDFAISDYRQTLSVSFP